MPEVKRETFLLRKGRVLEPHSKLRYRLWLLRYGRSMAFGGDDLSLVLVPLRLAMLPVLTVVDFLAWPLVRRTLGRGPWYVVEVRSRDVEVDLVRVAEAADLPAARRKMTELDNQGSAPSHA